MRRSFASCVCLSGARIEAHGRAPAQRSRRLCQRCVWCAEPSGAARIRAAERAYFANYRQWWPDYSPVGRAEWNHRMVNNMKRRKQKANTSKPASSPPLNAPAQALSGDETKRRMALARVCKAWARVPAGIANARARSIAAPIANREPQKSTAEGRKCGQLSSVEREGGC